MRPPIFALALALLAAPGAPAATDDRNPLSRVVPVVNGWLAEARLGACGPQPGGAWLCALERPGRPRAWLAWHPEGGTLPIPADWDLARIHAVRGGWQDLRVPPKTVTLGPEPVLLEGRGD